MKAKIILANATIIIIAVCVFLNGYEMTFGMPVYADSTTDGWTQVTTNQQLVEAFRYYCKSRDLTIEGSLADGVTSFTTKTFNGLCKTLGIDVTALQAEIKYQTDGNTGTKFLFTSLGIDAYNRIFSQFLQDNELSVGDTDVNKNVFSGKAYKGPDNEFCLIYDVYREANGHITTTYKVGTPYKYNTDDLILIIGSSTEAYTDSFQFYNGLTVGRLRLRKLTYSAGYSKYIGDGSEGKTFQKTYNGNTLPISCDICIYYDRRSQHYYMGTYADHYNDSGSSYYGKFCAQLSSSYIDDNLNEGLNSDVTINIVSTQINNNTYEGDTIINNNGTTGDDDNPSGGGGGGNTITPPGTIGGDGSDGTINFPDFNINLPEINWSLGDLSNKFPFSIPFDMIAFLTLLNGEPQAPHITGSIPLTSHYTWNLDLDFSQFDTFASIMRGLEFVGFMFFLISATINIVRG